MYIVGRRKGAPATELERDLSLHQLRLLCAVIESGSFSRAAQSLFITQPALTIQIRRLERALGVRLTERQGRRIVPTRVGAEVHRSARAILAHQQLLLAAVGAERSGAARPLAVGVTHNSFHRLIPALRAYRARHPAQEVTLELEPAERLLGRVVEGSVDVGFAWDYTAYAGAAWFPLGADEFALLASPARRPPARIEPPELAALPFIAVQNGPKISYLEETLTRRGVRVNVAMRVPSFEVARHLVAADLGVSILPLALVEPDLAAGELCRVELGGMSLRREYGYLLRPAEPAPATARFTAFLDGWPRAAGGA